MKNAKRIGIALLVVALLVTAVVFSSVAADGSAYTGTLTDFNALVDAVPADGTSAERETALTAVTNYLTASPVDPATEGYDAVVAKMKTKMAELASIYVGESAASTGADAKATIMTKAEKWAALAYETDEEKATDAAVLLYAGIHTENLAAAQLYYNDVAADDLDIPNVTGEGNTAAALAATAVKKLKSYVESHAFDASDAAYTAFKANCDALIARAAAAKEARYQDLLFNANLDEYGLGVAVNYNFEAGSGTPSVSSPSGTVGGVTVTNTVATEYEVIGVDAQGNEIKNGYRTLRWNGAVSSYFNLSYGAATSGMVIEFDITTFDKLPSKGIGFQPYAGSSWMGITASGDFYGYQNASDSTPKVVGAIVPGEWSRVTYVYKPNDRAHCELYLDYVFLGYVHGDYGNKGTTASALRMGNTASTSGSFSIDNVKCTRGTAIRAEDYLDGMNNAQLFMYYSAYMQKEAIAVPNRITAYTTALKLVGEYVELDSETNEPVLDADGELIFKALPSNLGVSVDELKAAARGYFDFDATTIIDSYKRLNLETLREMVDKLVAYVPKPTSASITERNNQLTAISNFILLNTDYIHDDSAELAPKPDYNYCMTAIGDVTARVATDTSIYNFINAMTAFRNATSIKMLTAKYDEASALLAGGVDVGLRFENGYESFKELYEVDYANAEAKIEASRNAANSKKFVDAVNFVLEAYPTTVDWKLYQIVRAEADWTAADINKLNAKYGASVVAPAVEWNASTIAKLNEELEYDLLAGWTDEKIAANNASYEYLFGYANMIMGFSNNGIDESYTGYVDAAEKISAFLDHYYVALQSGHADVIREQLDLFEQSNAFIEKQGILAYIERYMNENSVDLTNAEIVDLMLRFNTYKDELPPQEEGYAELLAQNTVYFINLSKQFGSAITYAEKRDLYDRATPYYYAMNVGTPEAQAAVALYDALTLELEIVEDASAGLIEAIMLLPTALDADTYFGYLVDAALCFELADASIEGVPEAIEAYTAVRDAYNLKVNTDNAQLKECGDALGSLRANCGLSAIISVIIAKLYSF